MRRQVAHPVRGRPSTNANNVVGSRNSRIAPNSTPHVSVSPNPVTTSAAIRNERSTPALSARPSSRLNAVGNQIIMTKAQMRRRNALLLNAVTNTIRTVSPAEGEHGPTVSTRNATPATDSTASGLIAPARAVSKRRFLSSSETGGISSVVSTSSNNEATRSEAVVPLRVIRTRARGRAEQSSSDRVATSAYSIQRYRRIRNRVSFALPDFDTKDSVLKVLLSEKILPRILSLMNWNELLPLRSVCKTWFETIESNPKVNFNFGIITFRASIEPKMAIYNASSVTWTKFRFGGPFIFDMKRSIQNEFWNKHGPLMTHLEINNRAMSLTGLVEILARCPKLEFFKCNWTPEMYSFNSELIKKYYGIHFNNGTFANLQHLSIQCSSSLTDSALGSILKWCGGSIRTLSLTSPPDEDILTRLKPRWSIDSIRNYYERFGYTDNLQYLDFSWSNLSNEDIKSLCLMEMHLRGITLNHCKLDDEALRKVLLKHGETLEVFKIEGTPFSDVIFDKEVLPKVKVLHIGGVKGTVHSLGFLKDMPRLEELSCHNTQWLEQNMVLRPFNSKAKQISMKSLDLGGGIRHSGNKNLDPNLNKIWFHDFIGLFSNLKELNLSQWSSFGTNMNFRNICYTLELLEKLIVRDWVHLNDVGTTGLYEEEIHQDWGTQLPSRPRVFLGQLQRLKVLDLSGTAITDATVELALYPLKSLRNIAIDGTRITDTGLHDLITKITSLDRISASKCPRLSITQPRFKRTDGRTVFFGKF